MTTIDEAKEFAQLAHAGQMYDGDLDYTYHLNMASEIAREYGLDGTVCVAAWLHDVIEGTTFTYTDIKQNFGFYIAEMVYAVTDELGRNRKERQEKTLPKTLKGGIDTIGLKLADRLANSRWAHGKKHGYIRMYQKEYPMFRGMLYDQTLEWPENLKRMWEELDGLMNYGL